MRRKLEFTDPQSTTFGLSELATNVAMPFETTPECCQEMLNQGETDKTLSAQTTAQLNQSASNTKPVSAFNPTLSSFKKSNSYLTPPRTVQATVKRLEIDDQSGSKEAFCKNITIELWKADKNCLSQNQS